MEASTSSRARTDAEHVSPKDAAGDRSTTKLTPGAATLTVTNPSSPASTTLTATAEYSNGTKETVTATWSLDRLDIASIGASTGKLTATATTFGAVHVTAMAAGFSAKATVTVDGKWSENPGMLSSAQRSALGAATTADPAVTGFAYPYDATVFPIGLPAPMQMWNGGVAGDAYSLEFKASTLDLTEYLTADPPSQFTLSPATWNVLTSSAAGGTVHVSLRRVSGTNAYTSATESWTISTANLAGAIYYWAISEGQIEKIDLASGTRASVFDSGSNTVMGTPAPFDNSMPATPPWESNGSATSNTRCVACHSVSKDGSTLSSVFSRAGSAGPLGFVNLATGAISDIGDYQDSTAFDALTPDGSQAVLNAWTMTMQLLSSATGQPIASALDGLANLSDPAFSPDGTKLALAINCGPAGDNSIEFQQSDLAFYTYSSTVAPYFTNPVTVVASTGVGDTMAFPSFSPDSQSIFFQRGSGSRAKITDPTTGAPEHNTDDLYVVSATAGATPIALASANNPGGALPADSQHLNYAPTVNPIAAGGYIWVVFTSPRDYGNAMVSPQMAAPMDASYANRKQLWVTAVDTTIGSADPSHPPFWLPGQDLTTINMFGYWALSPCLPTSTEAGASSCTAGFDCCSGFCRDQGSGQVCVDNVAGSTCSMVGEKCTTAASCCTGDGVSCVGGFCQQAGPQ
jgi:hypothetical protein